ncbi:YicC/YloC family endoribonuclease [Deltaproteobacteria bacterium TL4]
MIYSMTGYGLGQSVAETWRCTTEIRTVNQRFLDIRLFLPQGFQPSEAALKQKIKQACRRGKVDCNITLQNDSETAKPMIINTALAKAYAQVIEEFEKCTRRSVQVSLRDIASIKDLIQTQELDAQSPFFQNLIDSSLENALEQLQNARQKEGQILFDDIQTRLKKCEDLLKDIQALAKELPTLCYERLLNNLKALDHQVKLDQDRLHQEVAMFSDRCDITEEIVRFRIHLTHMEEIFLQREIGKKADFLLQEMNREINTIGSKASQSEVSQSVIAVKSELEKIREQVQNIE